MLMYWGKLIRMSETRHPKVVLRLLNKAGKKLSWDNWIKKILKRFHFWSLFFAKLFKKKFIFYFLRCSWDNRKKSKNMMKMIHELYDHSLSWNCCSGVTKLRPKQYLNNKTDGKLSNWITKNWDLELNLNWLIFDETTPE